MVQAKAEIAPSPRRKPGIPERIGKYVVINEVGQGSSGRVYLSHDPYYGRDVAIKVYNSDTDDSYNTDNSSTTMVITSMELDAVVTDVHVDAHGFKEGEIETGSIAIDNGALANFGGINTSSMNTGAASANQAATAVGARPALLSSGR